MRLLFITDAYPPLDKGGFAQLCHDLAHEMRGRGHDVTVLCAGPTPPRPDTEQVIRRLTVPVGWGERCPVPVQQVFLAAPRSRHNLRVFKQVVADAGPEAVMLWATECVDQQVMAAAESLPGSVAAYYIAGVSPTDPTVLEQYWANPGYSAAARLAKRVLRPLLSRGRRGRMPLRLQHVMCVSDYERRRVVAAGVPAGNTCVVHNGIDPAQFPFLGLPSSRRNAGSPLRVLYAGRLVEDKGAHTLVDAMAVLRSKNAAAAVTATLLGAGPEEYLQRIDAVVARRGLAEVIRRCEWVARSDMPALLADHDVLVLPTIRPEALSRAVQEAMAMGLGVVATPTGGTPEIVSNGETGLVFPAGDAAALARRLAVLSGDLALCDRLAAGGREAVTRSFTIAGMAEMVKEYFTGWLEMAASERSNRGGNLP